MWQSTAKVQLVASELQKDRNEKHTCEIWQQFTNLLTFKILESLDYSTVGYFVFGYASMGNRVAA